MHFHVLRETANLDRPMAAVNLEQQEFAADKDTSDLTSVTLLATTSLHYDTKNMKVLLTVVYILLILPYNDALPVVQFSYHSYDDVASTLRSLHSIYPQVSDVYSIGKSEENRELLVIAIGRSPKERELLVPNIKFVANANGNEALTKELLLHFAEHLLKNYGGDAEITSLLNRTVVHILPLLNPDGLERAKLGQCDGPGRENAKNMSVMEGFPDAFYVGYQPKQGRESEAVIRWLREYPFVLSASLYSGHMVVSIPYRNCEGSIPDYASYSPTPDNDVFQELANTYSFAHPTLPFQDGVCDPQEFHEGTLVNGTVNGAIWFALNGSMEDYNYVYGSCMEVVIHMGCCKYPPAGDLSQLWTNSKVALLSLARRVHIGVRGLILDEVGNPVTNVSVMISKRMPVQVSARGEFWKLLLPGNYVLEVLCDSKVIAEATFQILDTMVTMLNVTVNKNFAKRAAIFSTLPPGYVNQTWAHARCSISSAESCAIGIASGDPRATAAFMTLLWIAHELAAGQ